MISQLHQINTVKAGGLTTNIFTASHACKKYDAHTDHCHDSKINPNWPKYCSPSPGNVIVHLEMYEYG